MSYAEGTTASAIPRMIVVGCSSANEKADDSQAQGCSAGSSVTFHCLAFRP
jgi:hypothetical protein